MTKQTTNNQRLYLLDKIFTNAIYIHIKRDGRAVANSLVNVPWWTDTYIWWLGDKVRNWVKNGNGSKLELAALHWKKETNEIINFGNQTNNRYFELTYSQLCENPIEIIKDIIEFTELEWTKDYFKFIPQTLKNSNYKWRRDLSPKEKMLLNSIIY